MSIKPTDVVSQEHIDMIQAIFTSIGGIGMFCDLDDREEEEEDGYNDIPDSIDFSTSLDKEDKQTLRIRYVGERYGPGWVCFLDRWSHCFMQSEPPNEDGEENIIGQTPQTAYNNLLLKYQEKIDQDQNLLNRLSGK